MGIPNRGTYVRGIYPGSLGVAQDSVDALGSGDPWEGFGGEDDFEGDFEVSRDP